jgi:hypothetical protein
MVTSTIALEKYGDPMLHKNMMMWDVPEELRQGKIPKRIYCNRDMIKPLTQAFKNVIERGLVSQIETWDGCHNIRLKRGGKSWSLHSWGIAIDINAATNPWMGKPTMSPELVKCFTDASFVWGGYWKTTPDGMHFELGKL